ncbi:MAG: hypothetical protein ACN6QR_20160, partial [Pseudomonas protegens]
MKSPFAISPGEQEGLQGTSHSPAIVLLYERNPHRLGCGRWADSSPLSTGIKMSESFAELFEESLKTLNLQA